MRVLENCSGAWSGFWLQDGYRGTMRLTLSFASGQISGNGRDLPGAFHVSGEYGAEAVTLTKFYRRHKVEYQGKWDGQVMFGLWAIIRSGQSGEFEIWPEGEELSLEELKSDSRELVGSV